MATTTSAQFRLIKRQNHRAGNLWHAAGGCDEAARVASVPHRIMLARFDGERVRACLHGGNVRQEDLCAKCLARIEVDGKTEWQENASHP